MSMEYSEALSIATEAALAAGELLRAEFHRPGGPRSGGAHCEVDTRAEQLIRQRLTAAFPAWGYLGEETGESAGDPSTGHRWLVDPNDGTSAYLDGIRGSSVSIGLLRDGVPVLGVVYAFAAPDDGGDLFTWAEGCGPLRRQGREVEARRLPRTLGPKDVVLVSQDADRNAEANLRCVSPARYRCVPGIAYRLALVAAGEGDAAVSLSSPCAWDYGAGHALLRSAGGTLVDQKGRPVVYDRNGRSSCEACFGGGVELVEDLHGRPWSTVLARPKLTDQPWDLPFPVRLLPGKALPDQHLLSRAQGCLLGQVAGDSLGGLVEFQSADNLRRRYPEGLRLLENGGYWGILAGQPTDDSELALMLARSLLFRGGYDREVVARAYGYWYRSQPFDAGGTTSAALSAIKPGGGAALAATRAASDSSQANGSLMRISPLGVYGHALPPNRLAELARQDSALTHPHPVCQESCAVFAVTLARAVGKGGSPQELYEDAVGWAQVASREPSVVDAIREAADAPPADHQSHRGWVLVALQNAFYQLLHAPSAEEGIVASVMAGGDTDTNAAIAGALLGAVYGRDAMPSQWKQMILSCRPVKDLTRTRYARGYPFWPVDLLELSERLAAISPSASS